MKSYFVTATRTRRTSSRLAFEGGVETINYDYTPWSQDNGTVTAVVVTVETGDAAVANETLASNVKSFTVATSNFGSSLIKLVATTAGNNIDVQFLRVVAKDPQLLALNDYGLFQT